MRLFIRSLFILFISISSTCAIGQVVINEIMASNTTIVKDNAGEYDDWIELYNTSNSAFDLSGYYLTDSSGDLKKWKIKKGTIIPAKGYVIFWADEDSSQGNTNHVNFKLSSLGEMVLLVDSNKNIIDQITYGAQVTDKSYARYPNGTGPFSIRTSTHNYSNGGEVVSIENTQELPITIHPNPTSRKLYLNESESLNNAAYKILDLSGKTIKIGLYNGDIDITDISLGAILFRDKQNS
ncbi:MAG: lamin tail domain-containing protein [Bacteroidetes bacterium]|nr:lamin tail domain-containing protein [Bacteroidota bacterium]